MKNVKRTYFEDGWLAPLYELEDGTILVPMMNIDRLIWVTKEEGEKLKNVRHNYWHNMPLLRMFFK